MRSGTRRDKKLYPTLDEQLKSILGSEFSPSEPDWEQTIGSLLMLAIEANKAFEFEKAVNYLDASQQIQNTGLAPDLAKESRLLIHREKGKAFSLMGKFEKAIDEYKSALELCQDKNDLNIRSDVFTQIGQILAKKGDHERALGYLQRAISSSRRAKDNSGLCKALRNQGVVYVELGDFEEAEQALSEAIEIADRIDEKILYADLVNNLGAIMNMKGQWRQALLLYRESLNIYQENNEIRKAAYAKNNLGITLSEKDFNQEAFEYFIEASAIAEKINDSSLKLIVDINLADLYLKKGNIASARDHATHAEKFFEESKLVNVHLIEAKKIKGKIALNENFFGNAEKAFGEALKLSRQIGSKFHEAEVLHERGRLLRKTEKHFEALNDLEESYQIFKEIKAEGKKEQTEKVINSIEHLYLEIFNSIGKQVDRKDSYTKGHSDRVASLALLLAKEVGLRTHMLKTIVAAGLLHDIGKIKVSDEILKKPGKLTDEEFEEIKKHPEFGVEMLRGKEFPWDIKPIIMHHHERYNGSGYPKKIKGEDIPIGARIMCIADVFEALTSNRTYRNAFEVSKALEIMKSESGTTFDPVLLKSFVELIERGDADYIVNTRTRHDEMYIIWSQCMANDNVNHDHARDLISS